MEWIDGTHENLFLFTHSVIEIVSMTSFVVSAVFFFDFIIKNKQE